MIDLEMFINGVKFAEIPCPNYVVQGDEDKFPFLQSDVRGGVDPNSPNNNVHSPVYRVYKSIQVNGKFYAPVLKTNEQ